MNAARIVRIAIELEDASGCVRVMEFVRATSVASLMNDDGAVGDFFRDLASREAHQHGSGLPS